MRISNWILYLLTALLYGQNTQINSLNSNVIDDSLLTILSREPELSGEYKLTSFSEKPNRSNYKRIHKDKLIDSLIVTGLHELNPKLVNRFSSLFLKTPIGTEFMILGESLQKQYSFLYQIPSFEFGLTKKEQLVGRIHFSPKFESHFSGLFGMSQIENKWNVTGEMDLHLENLFQTAGIFELMWKRTDSLSQLIDFEVMDPHPLGWDFGIDFKYHHEVVGGLYSVIEKKSLLQFYSLWLNQFNVGYINGRTVPTLKGKENRYENVSYKAFAFSTKKDTRNNRFLPNKGMLMTTELDFGMEDKTRFMKGQYEFQYYYPVNSKIHGQIKFQGKGINNFDKSIPKSRYLHYGGSSTIRGFKEQIFSSPQYQITSLEIGYQANPTFEGNMFLDASLEKFNSQLKYGYGIGIIQINKQTRIQLQYAIKDLNRFFDGKLHIKWVSRL